MITDRVDNSFINSQQHSDMCLRHKTHIEPSSRHNNESTRHHNSCFTNSLHITHKVAPNILQRVVTVESSCTLDTKPL